MSAKPRAVLSFSSGKDSAYALHVARQTGELEVVAALTTITEEFDRVSMHGVRRSLLARQVAEMGLRSYQVPIPYPCPNAVYERAMTEAITKLRADSVTHMIFGDLYLEDLRAYREEKLEGTGITPVFPLWGRDTRALAHEMVQAGLRAVLACIDPKQLDRSFAGRRFDASLLADLPRDIDPCAERGEFHTAVVAGPMFRNPIATRVGEIVERDGFVFADVLEG